MAALAPPDLTYSGPHPDWFYALPADQQRELLEIYDMITKAPKGLTITCGNLKGGVAKTTTTVYLALMLGLFGESVLVVDGDAVNRSALLWMAACADWPPTVRVVCWASPADAKSDSKITGAEMVRRIQKVRHKFRHIVIDTSPQLKEYLIAGLKETDDFIVCTSPYPLDTQQIQPSVDLAAEVESMKAPGKVYPTVLIARAKTNTNSLKAAYQDLRDKGIAVFDQHISGWEMYPTSAGSIPTDFGEYVAVLRQLVESQVEEEATEDEDDTEVLV